jgi:hypothetical protein
MPRVNSRALKFAKVHPMLIRMAVAKGRTEAEVDEVTCCLTGNNRAGLNDQSVGDGLRNLLRRNAADESQSAADQGHDLRPSHRGHHRPVEQQVRWLDKLIDELAKGRPMEKIKRA